MFLCVDPKISLFFNFEQQLFFGSRVKTSQPPYVIHFHNRQGLSLLMVGPCIDVVKSKSQIILIKPTNCFFFNFWVSLQKKLIGCRSDNIDASGLPNTSSERIGPNIFQGTKFVSLKKKLEAVVFSREYPCFDCF